MTAPNKNEGLIARLTARGFSIPVARSFVNPDGPEAARAIQDLEEEVGRLRGLNAVLSDKLARRTVALDEALASTAQAATTEQETGS